MCALQLDLRSGRRSGNILTLECEETPRDLKVGALLKGQVTEAPERYPHLLGKTHEFSVEHIQNEKIGVAFAAGHREYP